MKEPQKKEGGARQTILNVFGVILCVIFIPVIILNVVMIVKSYTQPDEMPSVFGVSPVIVLSGSMSPAFEAGDMIFVQKTDPYALQVNDVICYMEEESAVTHRIVEIQERDGAPLYITKGDANNAADAVPVTVDQVKGKYMGFCISKLGNLAMFMQSTIGMVVFIVGPLLLIVLWDVVRRALASRRNAGESQKLRQETEQLQQELERLRAQAGQAASGQSGGENGGQDTLP